MANDDGDPTPSGQPIPPERLSSEAVRALYAQHGRDVLTFLAGVLRNQDSAADVCQATFQRLLESGHTAKSETIRGWLFKVAFHEAMEYRRKGARGDKVLQDYGSTSNSEVTLDLPLQSLVRAEEVARLRELLAELPADQRHVVQQRIHEGKTFVMIADELKVPLGTVLTRMRLAVEKLRAWFGRDK